MQRTIEVWIVAITITLCCALRPVYAQEQGQSGSQDSKVKSERPEKPVHAYRVDFSISESDSGKRINSRHYSMVLNSGPWSQIKIGTRVPISVNSNELQYMDLGTNIDCEVSEQGDDLAIDVRVDFSNLSGPEEQHSTKPIIRQVKLTGRTLIPLAKPTLIGAVDDPNSQRQFQLEATVTKLK